MKACPLNSFVLNQTNEQKVFNKDCVNFTNLDISFVKFFSVLEMIYFCDSNAQVLVVSGETGCGKTTQLPQFIIEEEISSLRGADCSVICTQPRRISAISVADRIASERGENLGETIGYQIRLESKRSAQTRLLFCTTGVLLRRLVAENTSFTCTFFYAFSFLFVQQGSSWYTTLFEDYWVITNFGLSSSNFQKWCI